MGDTWLEKIPTYPPRNTSTTLTVLVTFALYPRGITNKSVNQETKQQVGRGTNILYFGFSFLASRGCVIKMNISRYFASFSVVPPSVA